MNENVTKKVIGVVVAIVSIAVTLGYLTPESADTVNQTTTGLVENISGAVGGLVALWMILVGKKK